MFGYFDATDFDKKSDYMPPGQFQGRFCMSAQESQISYSNGLSDHFRSGQKSSPKAANEATKESAH